jgi:hypothetical protein
MEDTAMNLGHGAKVGAFLFGMGTVLDLRAHAAFVGHNRTVLGSIGSDFRRVGEFLAIAGDRLEAEVKEQEDKQMSLKLNG